MTKLADALLNTEETYRNLQPFATVEELNANTKAIRSLYADEMTPATYDVLDVLHRYACKFAGVCFLSKAKIAKELGIATRTVLRACNKLSEMGVIVQHATKRRGGDKRQSSNAIVFVDVRSFVSVEVTDCQTECRTGSRTVNTPLNTPLKAKTLYTNDTGASAQEEISGQEKNENQKAIDPTDKANLAASLPEGWYDIAAPYAADFNDLYAITGALFKGKHGTTLKVEDYLTDFGDVLRKAWIAIKNGKVASEKWYAYLFAGFKRTAHDIERKVALTPILSGIAASLEPTYVPESAPYRGFAEPSMDDLMGVLF
ncbi:HTH domain-containing protein [Sporosarcina phage Lietuvens]|nr:HTH domain-containing protein [Sporosarcina phage Lietuvens]